MKTLRLTAATALLALLALALAPVAGAEAEEETPAVAPPGNSAVDQYRETLPAPGGNRLTGKGRERSPERVIGAQNTKKLEQYGEDGEAVVDLVAETAPGGVTAVVVEGARSGRGKQGGSKASGPGSVAGIDNEPTSSALAEVAGQATGVDGSGGIGWLLPLVVVLALVGAVAYALGRRGAPR